MTVVSPTACTYELGEEWRIVAVDAAWSVFAASNGAPQLIAPAPIGRRIFDYITDATTATLYERVLDRVAAMRQAITVPIRCDAPAVRRWLEIDIKPRRPGVTIHSRVVREEARAEVPLLGRSEHGTEGEDAVRMCSWCKRVSMEERWCEIEQAVPALRLSEREHLPDVTHGTCPDCYEQMLALLER